MDGMMRKSRVIVTRLWHKMANNTANGTAVENGNGMATTSISPESAPSASSLFTSAQPLSANLTQLLFNEDGEATKVTVEDISAERGNTKKNEEETTEKVRQFIGI
jgi:hypothetical protein